jgi:hypothetical protein
MAHEDLKAELKELDETYLINNEKDELGNPVKPSDYFFISESPFTLMWQKEPSNRLKKDIVSIIDKYLPRQ